MTTTRAMLYLQYRLSYPYPIFFDIVIMGACAKSGRSKAQGARLEPNIISYNAVIDACAESGDKNVALHLFEAMSLNRVVPDHVVLKCVMRTLVTASQFDPGFQHDLFSSGLNLSLLTADEMSETQRALHSTKTSKPTGDLFTRFWSN